MAFATGTKVDSRLMMADYSGFAKAGEIQGEAMKNFGESIAGGVTKGIAKFVKKKEDDKKTKLGVDYTMSFIKQEPNLSRKLGIEFEDPEGFYDEEIARKSATDYVKISGVDKLTENILAMQNLAQKSRSNTTQQNIAQREEFFDVLSAQRLGSLAKTMPNVDIVDGRIMYDTNEGWGEDYVGIETLSPDNPLYKTFVDQPGSGPFGLVTGGSTFVPGIQSGGVIKYRPTVEAIPTPEPTESLVDTSGFSVVKD